MSIDDDQLQKLVTQQYKPTRFGISSSYLEDSHSRKHNTSNIAEIYHENSKIKLSNKKKLESSSNIFLENDKIVDAVESLSPDYLNYPKIELPEPTKQPDTVNLFTVLNNRRSVQTNQNGTNRISIEKLSNILYYSYGLVEVDSSQPFRRYPSAGALYPVELYIHLPNPTESIVPGFYYYAPHIHSLRLIREDKDNKKISKLFADSSSFNYTDVYINVFLTGVFSRCFAKYGSRAYRYILAEAGHIAQNISLVSTAFDFGMIPRGGYIEYNIDDALGLDGTNESVIYCSAVC